MGTKLHRKVAWSGLTRTKLTATCAFSQVLAHVELGAFRHCSVLNQAKRDVPHTICLQCGVFILRMCFRIEERVEGSVRGEMSKHPLDGWLNEEMEDGRPVVCLFVCLLAVVLVAFAVSKRFETMWHQGAPLHPHVVFASLARASGSSPHKVCCLCRAAEAGER
jgi:hypothetical protein